MNKINVAETPEGIKISTEGKNKNDVTIGNGVFLSIKEMSDYRSLAKALQILGRSMEEQYKKDK